MHRLDHRLAEQNPAAAQRAMAAIREGMRGVARQPGIGRPVADLPPAYREWRSAFAGGVVARYRWDGQTAVVLAVRHSREAGDGDDGLDAADS